MKMQFAVGMGRSEKMDEIGDHARVAEESGFSNVVTEIIGMFEACLKQTRLRLSYHKLCPII